MTQFIADDYANIALELKRIETAKASSSIRIDANVRIDTTGAVEIKPAIGTSGSWLLAAHRSAAL